jgi:hypothetical protein
MATCGGGDWQIKNLKKREGRLTQNYREGRFTQKTDKEN